MPPSSSSFTPLYTFDEHVLVADSDSTARDSVSPSSSNTRIQVKSVMGWDPTTAAIHPFANLANALIPSHDQVGRSASADIPRHQLLQVTMSIASRPSQTIPIPLESSSSPMPSKQFPAGFWLEITSRQRPFNTVQLDYLIQHWKQQRFLVTPIQEAIWDIYAIHDTQDTQDIQYKHQIFLPTNGVAWSADALQQFFQAILPDCYTTTKSQLQYFGLSAMEWSQWFVHKPTQNKQFWFQFSTIATTQYHVEMGIQLDVPSSHIKEILPKIGLLSNNNNHNITKTFSPSCPLATRTVHHYHNKNVQSGTTTYATTQQQGSLATLDQVIRRTLPNHGRLETYFEYDASQSFIQEHSCQLQLRQKLPFYMIPSWQSLNITIRYDDDHYHQPGIDYLSNTVEWDPLDFSSVLTVIAHGKSTNDNNNNNDDDSKNRVTSIPSSLVMTLDYEPAFLSLDDFPGDPNRGRELPPMVATLQCDKISTTTAPSTTATTVFLYSNSLLLLPPVPDMSMPFNVLSLTCSLYAYIVGTLVTLMVKRSSERIQYKLHPERKPARRTLRDIWIRIQTKLFGKKYAEQQE